jgi:hypothetical protein
MLFIAGGQKANFQNPHRRMLFRKLGSLGREKYFNFLRLRNVGLLLETARKTQTNAKLLITVLTFTRIRCLSIPLRPNILLGDILFFWIWRMFIEIQGKITYYDR